ncbi:acyltransferase [Leptothoe sp. LEGE 181152]|nr:acyltransferase [Leptothoe sp. LEGE 181152]
MGVRLQGYAWIGRIEIPRNFNDIELGIGCSLDSGVVLLSSGEETIQPKICIGESTYINRNTFIDASISIKIGRQCGIGPGCYITDHDHGMQANLPPLNQPLIVNPTYIFDRAWLGANVTVLKGVTIGKDSVIGAGSVVTKDIPAGAIAVGVPAKVIKFKPGFAPLTPVN